MAPGSPPVSLGWSRRKVAELGIALWLPFVVLLVLELVVEALLPGSASYSVLQPLLILMIPLSLIGTGGILLTFAAWITPPGQRPFIDPLRLR